MFSSNLFGQCGQTMYAACPAMQRSSAMAIFDDEPRKKAPVHEIGQDLSRLSAGELQERIRQLNAEIARLETELSSKGATKAAAEAFFRRG
jgi:uncharacterized small protein (DUF1192 family)